MSRRFVNSKIITPNGVQEEDLYIQDSLIEKIGPKKNLNKEEVIDCQGDYLLPGLIELHTDNLEGEFQPRPGVLWPSPMAALYSHDATIIASGITTVLDSISCGQLNEGKMRHEIFSLSLKALANGHEQGILRADHRLHLRCEICDPYVLEMFTPNVDNKKLSLVSLMDHTPGQRQFTNIEKYKEYYGIEDIPEAEFQEKVTALKSEQEKFAEKSRSKIIRLCKERQIPLASHDDTTIEHVAQAINEGLHLSEFPTTMEAASAAAQNGLGIIMGAPNVVRNGSHSGNVSARELAKKNFLHILSSDYVPVSLLHAAYILHSKLGKKLQHAFATLTRNPAEFLGLNDRGAIVPGKRADLLRMRIIDGTPVVKGVWVKGEKVF